MTTGPAPRTARERGRAELVAALKASAARQLAEVGAAGLSLRAVARDLGLVSSAVYRYFPSRDALLTALIVDAYDAVGEAAERADDRARRAGEGPGARWLAVCRGVRRWAQQHPHEYALLYGSPVPGYAAPQDTVAPALRLTLVMTRVLREALDTGVLEPPRHPLPPPRLATPTAVEVLGGVPAAPYEDVVERALVLLAGLVGCLTYELFGHLVGGVTDAGLWFDRAVAVVAEGVGLLVPLGG